MKRKILWLPAIVGLLLLAVYGIWYYSPLKLLTPSGNAPRQTQVAAFVARNQPVVIKKKIPPRSERGVQQSDIPRPLVVLEDTIAKNAAEPVGPNKTPANSANEKQEALMPQPDSPLVAKNTPSESAPSQEAASKTIRTQASAIYMAPESHLPYSILLSSCRLPQSARKIVAERQKAGLAPYVVKVEYENGDVWLRVLTGQYPTRSEALQVKKTYHLSDAIVKKTPYANLVGSFSSEKEAKDALNRLKGLGYSPYVLKRAANQFQVIVGAFITREGAEKQKSELQSKGVVSEIIER
jgi:cell division septation protein DedD